ncbi:MAG TPA: toll/interleukin-1 receptor domain-containing protein [Gemmata sp.]|nr:toll/interleukin-1 receptor domain-containing protein [Gemmata sp.]
MPRIFISYRRHDSGYVASMLAEKIAAQFGEESVFLDIDNIPLGVDFRTHIDQAVGRCDILLALIGVSWLDAADENGTRRLEKANDFVCMEIQSALQRDILVIPVLLDGARMPLERELPSAIKMLAFRNAATLHSGQDLRAHVNSLVNGLKGQSAKGKNERSSGVADTAKINLHQPSLVVVEDQPRPPAKKKPPHEAPQRHRPVANRTESPARVKIRRGVFRTMFLLYVPRSPLIILLHILFYLGFAACGIFFPFVAFAETENGNAVDIIAKFFVFFLLFGPLYLFVWLPAFLLDRLAAQGTERKQRQRDQDRE